MKKKTSVAAAIILCAIGLTGCDEKKVSDKITHYSTDKCFIDSIDGKPASSVYVDRKVVEFSGWAIDSSKGTAPDHLTLRLTGINSSPNRFNNPVFIDRPDLVKAFNNEKVLRAGFNFKADLSSLEPGGYGMILEIPDGRSMLVCQVKKTLVVQ